MLVAVLAGLMAIAITGCHQPAPGETDYTFVPAWPIFDLEKSRGIDPDDGTMWEKEKGDACCWLATWEKERKYDKDNFLIYRKEKSGFFPIFSTEVEENKEVRKKKGIVFIWPHESTHIKTQPAQTEQGKSVILKK